MENQIVQYEKVLDLKEIMIACLRKWRSLIVALLVGAVLLGAWDYVNQTSPKPEADDPAAESGAPAESTEAESTAPEGEEAPAEEAGLNIKSLIIKAVLGGILGIIVVCGCVCVKIFCKIYFGKKLQSTEDLCRQLRIPVIASLYVPVGSKKMKHPTGIDRALDKWEGADRVVDEKEAYKVAAAKLSVMTGDKKTVLVVGTGDKQRMVDIAKQLNGALENESLTYIVAYDLLGNPEGILHLRDSAVLLVESETETEEKQFVSLLEFIFQSKADLTGVVIL